MTNTKLIDTFQRARGGKNLAVIEGAQALKHAARFNADLDIVITFDIKYLTNLLKDIAPDISHLILKVTKEISQEVFEKLSPQPPRTKVIALAARKKYRFSDIDQKKPIIFLENPKDLENIGAVIRVAAAADAGAVVISSPSDIWHPAVIRGAAGLQYAIPVFNKNLSEFSKDRQIVALDPIGEDIKNDSVPKNAVLIFGTERYGITKATLDKADRVLRIPMKDGVSSLNLATSVAATLYMM